MAIIDFFPTSSATPVDPTKSSHAALDMTLSNIGGSLFSAYSGTAITENADDIELQINVKSSLITGAPDDWIYPDPETESFIRKIDQVTLIPEADPETGLVVGSVTVNGMTFEGDDFKDITVQGDYNSSSKKITFSIRVTAENGVNYQDYTIIATEKSGDTSLRSVFIDSSGNDVKAELVTRKVHHIAGAVVNDYQSDGIDRFATIADSRVSDATDYYEPMSLSLEEAEARYYSMGLLADGAEMTEEEKALYYDNGVPIKRIVYRICLENNNSDKGILSSSLSIAFLANNTTAKTSAYNWTNKKWVNGARRTPYLATSTETSGSIGTFSGPLIAVRDTANWMNVCVRSYANVTAANGDKAYYVLEIYNSRLGNYRLATVRTAVDAYDEIKIDDGNTYGNFWGKPPLLSSNTRNEVAFSHLCYTEPNGLPLLREHAVREDVYGDVVFQDPNGLDEPRAWPINAIWGYEPGVYSPYYGPNASPIYVSKKSGKTYLDIVTEAGVYVDTKENYGTDLWPYIPLSFILPVSIDASGITLSAITAEPNAVINFGYIATNGNLVPTSSGKQYGSRSEFIPSSYYQANPLYIWVGQREDETTGFLHVLAMAEISLGERLSMVTVGHRRVSPGWSLIDRR